MSIPIHLLLWSTPSCRTRPSATIAVETLLLSTTERPALASARQSVIVRASSIHGSTTPFADANATGMRMYLADLLPISGMKEVALVSASPDGVPRDSPKIQRPANASACRSRTAPQDNSGTNTNAPVKEMELKAIT